MLCSPIGASVSTKDSQQWEKDNEAGIIATEAQIPVHMIILALQMSKGVKNRNTCKIPGPHGYSFVSIEVMSCG